MAVPKRRHSNSRTGSRRAHQHKEPRQVEVCMQCSAVKPSHAICPNCGHYMGRKVMETEE